jgi:tetratricopeptide (TPR) repeat protein
MQQMLHTCKKGNPHMRLADEKSKQLDNPNLTPDKSALLRCRIAAEHIHSGQYEAAQETLGNLWNGIGQRPQLKGLAVLTTAEVLLQCGILSGWLGSTKQLADAQEKAKDLITEAQRIFQSLKQTSRVAESQYELGTCYWRSGACDDARIILDEAIKALGEKDNQQKAKFLVRRTLVEISESRYHDAWNILNEAEPVFENCSDAIKGKWHGQRALVLRRLATAEGRTDYADRAIIEFTAAIHHCERAKHERYCATSLNNLAMLLYKLGRHPEAHEHLDRARKILTRLKDAGLLAQVDETRARVLLAEGRYKEAMRVVSGAVNTLEGGGEQGLLADALTVKATVQARLGDYDLSIRNFQRAINVAENAGSLSNAGFAALALVEEHGREGLSEVEVYHVYRRADRLLAKTQDAEDIARLRGCARIVMRRLFGAQMGEKDFFLHEAVMAYEGRLIEQALKEERGLVTRAAKRLGLTHQALGSILKGRHKKLLHKRTPPASRKR